MTAPERTWLYVDIDDEGDRYMELISEHAHSETDVEYIRADIHAARIAELDRQLAEARMAVALAYQRAADEVLEHKHFAKGIDCAADCILAFADQNALAEVQALRAEVARLREVERDQIEARVEAVARRNFVAPEDAAVEALCVRFGYGAVMDAASRLWARRDMLGAFYIGGCIGFRTEEGARAALQETKP